MLRLYTAALFEKQKEVRASSKNPEIIQPIPPYTLFDAPVLKNFQDKIFFENQQNMTTLIITE